MLAVILMMTGVAWSCVGLVAFRVEGSSTVEPGATVKVFGGAFAAGQPVSVRLDSPNGPVLATVDDPQPSTMTSRFTVDVPLPGDISQGPHVLVATQEHQDMNAGIPARVAIHVGTSEPIPADIADRPDALAVSSGPSTTSLVLIGLGAAAAGLLLAAGWSLLTSRRSSARAERATAG